MSDDYARGQREGLRLALAILAAEEEKWAALLGERRTRGAGQVRYVATLAYSDGSSPPPAPGQRVLRVEGDYAIYGGIVAPG